MGNYTVFAYGNKTMVSDTLVVASQNKQKVAYFASGCFWCVEAIFESVKGVKEVISGYAGGTSSNPTYEQVGRGLTNYAETVAVYYYPNKVSFETLLQVFFLSHDPTTVNRQGPDRGPQYRSIAFYSNEKEKKEIEAAIKYFTEKNTFKDPIVTEISKFEKFYKAENYHQNYKRRNPNNPYIKNVSVPRLSRFKSKFPKELLKKN